MYAIKTTKRSSNALMLAIFILGGRGGEGGGYNLSLGKDLCMKKTSDSHINIKIASSNNVHVKKVQIDVGALCR